MKTWKDHTDSIIIKGKLYKSNEIENLSVDFPEPFEMLIYDFIKYWISKEEFIIQRTSGTTGKPKEIKIHKDSLVFSALNTAKFFDLQIYDKCLLCLPVDYIAGKMMIVRAFVSGLDLDYIKPSGLIQTDKKYKFCAMTPFQLQNSISILDNIDKLIIGGAPVSKSLIETIQYCNTEIYETYGMTETASHIALKRLNGTDKSDFFTVLEGIEITSDKNSRLVISSKGLRIKKIITNDVVRIIDKNTFQWLGRLDNVINSGGIKLHPEIIEMKLKPFIKNDFFIFGLKNEKFNESPAIVIEGKAKKDLNYIFAHNLNKIEIPVKVFYLDKFIRTDSNKVNRKRTLDFLDFMSE
ncbi:MAG: AMP-binding protein [Saprospiraceae bacterium]|nr:AMP-binding protein [Saprospiraceae bacterium]